MASWSSRVAGGASLGSSGGLLYIPGTAMVTSAQLTPVGMPMIGVNVGEVLDDDDDEDDGGGDDEDEDEDGDVEVEVEVGTLDDPGDPVGPVAVPTTVPTVGLPAAAVDRHGLVISSVPTRIAATAAMAPTNMSERRRR